jgi:hypothetical protein
MRKANRSASSPTPSFSGAGRNPPSEQLLDFCRGLQPILLDGDVDGFRRYLRRWEDLVGDTADLAETPDAQARRTMDALLRRPGQYGLPPWPTPVIAVPTNIVSVDTPELPPVDVSPLTTDEEWISPERAAAPDDEADDLTGAPPCTYQLDMLTGELIPLDGFDDAGRTRDTTPPSRTPRRRRRPPSPGMEQLSLWPTP